MADEELERAIALVTRLRGMRVVGCPGGCAPEDLFQPVTNVVHMLGDVFRVLVCRRCLSAEVRRTDDDVGYAQGPTPAGVWLPINANYGPWHLALEAEDASAQRTLVPLKRLVTICGLGLTWPHDPVRALRTLGSGIPLEGRCQNCVRRRSAPLAATHGPAIYQELRRRAEEALREGGHDVAILGKAPIVSHIEQA